MEGFCEGIRNCVSDFKPFVAGLGDARVFHNEDMSRQFVGLLIDQGNSTIVRLIESLDALLGRFDKPQFYTPMNPHVSIAWALGEATEQLRVGDSASSSDRASPSETSSAALECARSSSPSSSGHSVSCMLLQPAASSASTLGCGGGRSNSSSSSYYCCDSDSATSITDGAASPAAEWSPKACGTESVVSTAPAHHSRSRSTSCCDIAWGGRSNDVEDDSHQRQRSAFPASAEHRGSCLSPNLSDNAAATAAALSRDATAPDTHLRSTPAEDVSALDSHVVEHACDDPSMDSQRGPPPPPHTARLMNTGPAAAVAASHDSSTAMINEDEPRGASLRVSWRVGEVCATFGRRVVRFPL